MLAVAFNASAAEKSISIQRDFSSLYGTLLTPDDGAETVALIIAGSGPIDRNGLANGYLYLAQELEKAGIVSLRYDKRAIGMSAFANSEKLSDVVFEDYIGDVSALVDYLADEGFRRIVLIGHSEGALLTLCAAQQNPKVSALVSLCGAGYPLDQILTVQLSAQLIPSRMDLLMQANAITAKLKRGERVESVPQELESLFNASVQNFWISSLQFNSCKEIQKVGIPILILAGDNDLQVSVTNAEELLKAQPQAKMTIIEGMNHALRKSEGKTVMDQINTYVDSSLPIDSEMATAIVDFIRTL